MIHKEGRYFLSKTFIIFSIFIILSYFLFEKYVFYIILFFLLSIYSILMFFFRKNINDLIYNNETYDENIIISPSDGKIIDIKQVYEDECLNIKCIKISIFLSIFDKHINIYPISGKILYKKHFQGGYKFAFYKNSLITNEHTNVLILTTTNNLVLIKQIAGFLTRRIICYAEKNKKIQRGEELGFIKFGSRIDIFIPINSSLLIKNGDKVICGVTKISIIK